MHSTTQARTRAGTWLRFGAIVLVLWSLVGGLVASPAYARALTAAAAVDCPPPTAEGQVIYGCNDLSRNLQGARLYLNENKSGQTDTLFKNARRSNYAMALMDDGTYIIGHSDSVKHGEERLLDQMNGRSQRVVWDPASRTVSLQPARSGQIVGIFSELEPCANKCSPALQNAGLRNKVTWSWRWNGAPGATADEIKQIRDVSNNSKTGLKTVAVRQLFANGAPGPIADPENISSGARNAIGRQTAARPLGGIDFSSIQLRYVSDGNQGGNTYSFKAPATPGQPSSDGTGAILDAFNAMTVWMTVEPSKFWVNLNPDEPDRIIDSDLAATDVGRILLEADLKLKESGTTLSDPNNPTGARLWQELDAAGLDSFCTRDWIVPKVATVRTSGSELFILDAPLEVKAEADSFNIPGGGANGCPPDSTAAVEIYKRIVIPELTRIVNESPEYTDLRRVYISRVAAEWFRPRMVNNGTADDFGIDSNEVSTLEAVEDWNPRDVFDRYVAELNNTEVPFPDGSGRTFIGGGVDFTQPVEISGLDEPAFQTQFPNLPTVVQKSVTEVTKTTDGRDAFAGGVDVVPPLLTPAEPTGNEPLPRTGSSVTTTVAAGVLLVAVGAFVVWWSRRFAFRRTRR